MASLDSLSGSQSLSQSTGAAASAERHSEDLPFALTPNFAASFAGSLPPLPLNRRESDVVAVAIQPNPDSNPDSMTAAAPRIFTGAAAAAVADVREMGTRKGAAGTTEQAGGERSRPPGEWETVQAAGGSQRRATDDIASVAYRAFGALGTLGVQGAGEGEVGRLQYEQQIAESTKTKQQDDSTRRAEEALGRAQEVQRVLRDIVGSHTR